MLCVCVCARAFVCACVYVHTHTHTHTHTYTHNNNNNNNHNSTHVAFQTNIFGTINIPQPQCPSQTLFLCTRARVCVCVCVCVCVNAYTREHRVYSSGSYTSMTGTRPRKRQQRMSPHARTHARAHALSPGPRLWIHCSPSLLITPYGLAVPCRVQRERAHR